MKELRAELSSADSLRRALAARALGALHDREAVAPLIPLTGEADPMVAQAAALRVAPLTQLLAAVCADTAAMTLSIWIS